MLKATLARWWVDNKQAIHEWAQCGRLMMVCFSDSETYLAGIYDGWTNPIGHLMNVRLYGHRDPRMSGSMLSFILWMKFLDTGI